MHRYDKKILVDLTPVLKGGTNGGAKVFVLELLKNLIEIRPNFCWIMVIRDDVKEELAHLEAENVVFIIEQKIVTDHLLLYLQTKGAKYVKNNPLVPVFVFLYLKKIFNHYLEKRKFKKMMLENFDLLFCPFTAPSYYKEHIPTVCVIYDLQYKTFPFFFSSEDVGQRHATFLDTCKKATKIITISDYSKEKIVEHSQVSVKDIKTIYLSLAHRLNSNKNSDHVLKKAKVEPRKYFIYPANYWKHKNHEMLITAFELAKSSDIDADIKLVLTGAPCERQAYLKKIVRKKGLEHQILILDYIAIEDLACLMKYSLALVFPSLYEGFGIPLIEAMSLNIPIACSDMTSLPEIASDAALLFDPRKPEEIAESLRAIAQDDILRARLIKNGQERLKEFLDTKKMALDYLKVFEEAIEKKHEEDHISGLYADNWIGEKLSIQAGKNAKNSHVELEFFVPDFLKYPVELIISKFCFAKKKISSHKYRFESGEKTIVQFPLSHMGAKFTVEIKPFFRPQDLLKSLTDKRSLSLMLTRCEVVRDPVDIFQDIFFSTEDGEQR